MTKVRLQRIIADAGICSRRKAEILLSQNRVLINGQIAKLGDKADPSLRSDVEAAVAAVKSALEGEDEALIKEKTEALSTTMMKLGEAAYSGDSDDKDGEPTSEKNLNENSDEVVDADFEEIDDSDKDNEEDMKKAN